MHSISMTMMFEAAHRLRLHEGACRNVHGHSYKLEVAVVGDGLIPSGPGKDMVVDFSKAKKAIKEIIYDGDWCDQKGTPFDHSLMLHVDDPLYRVLTSSQEVPMLEALPEFRIIGMVEEPTAEYMSRLIANLVQRNLEYHELGVSVLYVRLWETKDNMAQYDMEHTDGGASDNED